MNAVRFLLVTVLLTACTTSVTQTAISTTSPPVAEVTVTAQAAAAGTLPAITIGPPPMGVPKTLTPEGAPSATPRVVIKLPPVQEFVLPLPTPTPGPSPTPRPYQVVVITNGNSIAETRELFLSNGWEILDTVAPLCAVPGTSLYQDVVVADAEDVVEFTLDGTETPGLVLWVVVSDPNGEPLSSGPIGYISAVERDGTICIQPVAIKKIQPSG